MGDGESGGVSRGWERGLRRSADGCEAGEMRGE